MLGPAASRPPFRVAVIGAGPAGFYLTERLLTRDDVEVDLFDRLPAPYGLVRYGVAPDHEKIRNVTRVFDRIAANSRFRFFGNVDVGRHLTLADLRQHYDQVAFTTGAQTDRRMGIPGEDLAGSHAATEFVAWYNGHPDFRDRTFDLSVARVVVVGVGNVAVDVARILCRTPDELARTDIADHALAALQASRVREVVMVGRRGPAQAAFTNAELRELGELAGADVRVRPDEVALDPVSRAAADTATDGAIGKKLEILAGFARRATSGASRVLTLRFLASPVALIGDRQGRVARVRLVRNRLELRNGAVQAIATDEVEEIDAGLVFRSVGYRGVAIPGLPFDEQRGVVPNRAGRVIDPGTGSAVPGYYVAGWIKRGPTGVIGTNKPDAAETAAAMLADLPGDGPRPAGATAPAALTVVQRAQAAYVSYADWLRLQAIEIERGSAAGRPRVKFTSVAELLAAKASAG